MRIWYRDGTHFSYHGECDLVLTETSTFGNGLGLHLHIRTTKQGAFSFISGAALKIGSNVLEVVADGSHYFNGKAVKDLPEDIVGYGLAKQSRMTCPVDSDNVESCHPRIVFSVDLGYGEDVKIVAFKGMLRVQVDAVLHGAAGLMGTFGKKGLIARDGKTVLEDSIAMGSEWQVAPTEPQLFRMAREPQFPEVCVLPDSLAESAGRRLGEDAALRRMAEQACANVANEDMKAACIFDVQQTGDADLALAYGQDFE